MVKIENVTKAKLDKGEMAIGVGLRQSRTADTAKVFKQAGFDWLFVDLEHSALSLDEACSMSVAAQDAGITPIARVPGFEHHHAARLLDCGAQGIVFPHVDDPETAKRLASYCVYPPAGKRSMTGTVPQTGFASLPAAEAAPAINDATLVIMMIESPEAVENAEAIAAIDGVTGLLIGTNDFCMEMGIPGQYDAPQVVAAYERVIAACRKHGKHAGMGGVYNPEQAARYIDMGMRMVLAGSDLAFMMAAGRQASSAMRGALKV